MRRWEKQYERLSSIDKVLHASRVYLGHYQERRLIDVLTKYLATTKDRPDYIVRLELANEEQDALGIDVNVVTDIGDVYLQIKSSEKMKQKFQEKGRRLWKEGRQVPITGIVVVNDHKPDSKIIGQTLAEIRRVYVTVQNLGTRFMPVAPSSTSSTSE